MALRVHTQKTGADTQRSDAASIRVLLRRAHQSVDVMWRSAHSANDRHTASQHDVLAAVAAKPGTTQTALCEMTGIDRSTLSVIVRRLLRENLVRRPRNKRDGRAYAVEITAKGAIRLENGRNIADKIEGALHARIGNIAGLRAALRSVISDTHA